MENSTKVFEGVSIQNIFGSHFVSIYDNCGSFQFKLDELNRARIIEAKYYNGIIVIIYFASGKYMRIICGIKDNKITSKIVKEISGYTEINFTVLNNGVCVLINENEEIEVFSKNDVYNRKIINDSSIRGDMKLYTNGNSVLAAVKNKLFQIKLKK